MATMFSAIYNYTKKWTAIVDGSIADGYSGVDRMIQQGIRQTTNMMTGSLLPDETTKKTVDLIVDLLEHQALRLQGKCSNIADHISDIHRVIKDAGSGDVDSIGSRIEALRLAGYRDDQVFPRNRAEIEGLIEAKRSLASLQPIFQFCDQVKKAQESGAAPDKIKELLERSKGFDGIENCEALRLARSILQNLSTVKPPAASLPGKVQPAAIDQAPENVSYLRWGFTLVYNCVFYFGSLPWRAAKSVLHMNS